MSAPPRVPPVPAVLRLVQTMVLGRWRATGEELYREVAELVEAQPGKEIIVSGAGEGETSEWLATKTGASVTGVDPSEERIERAEARARELKSPLPLSYQHAALDDLPHESNVFDAALAEPLLSSAADAPRAVAELARVTKPMCPVVLLQLTWSSEMSESAREMLIDRAPLRRHQRASQQFSPSSPARPTSLPSDSAAERRRRASRAASRRISSSAARTPTRSSRAPTS